MKIFRYILPALVILSSCEKLQTSPESGQRVILDWPGYIWFDAEAPKTKTTAVTDMSDKSFNLIAFKYGSNWNTFKATGTPASAMSDAEPYGFSFPTTVSCDADGVCDYDASNGGAPVEWDGTQKYSFFAWHPATTNGTVSLTTGQSTAGVPAIKYTVPAAESEGFINASNIPDVLIANTTDVQNTGAGVVSLNFSHALCLLTVEARNLKAGTIADISNLVMAITSQRYGNITIPLDGSTATPGDVTNNFKCRMQPTSGNGSSVPVPEFGIDGSSSNTSISYPNYNTAYIPQGSELGELTGSLSFTVGFRNAAEPHNAIPTEEPNKVQTFESTKALEAGKKYAFVITIAADESISIAIIESGAWDEKTTDLIFE